MAMASEACQRADRSAADGVLAAASLPMLHPLLSRLAEVACASDSLPWEVRGMAMSAILGLVDAVRGGAAALCEEGVMFSRLCSWCDSAAALAVEGTLARAVGGGGGREPSEAARALDLSLRLLDRLGGGAWTSSRLLGPAVEAWAAWGRKADNRHALVNAVRAVLRCDGGPRRLRRCPTGTLDRLRAALSGGGRSSGSSAARDLCDEISFRDVGG